MAGNRERLLHASNERYSQEPARFNERPSSSSHMARNNDQLRGSSAPGLKRSSGYDPAMEVLYDKWKRMDDGNSYNETSRFGGESSARYGGCISTRCSPGRRLVDYGAAAEDHSNQKEYGYPDDFRGFQSNAEQNLDKNINPKYDDPYVDVRHLNRNYESSRQSDELRRVSYSQEKELLPKRNDSYSRDDNILDKNYEVDRFSRRRCADLTLDNTPFVAEGVLSQDVYLRSKTERDPHLSQDARHEIFDERFSGVNKNYQSSGGNIQQKDNYDRHPSGRMGDGRSLDNSNRSKNYDELPEYIGSSLSKYNDPKGYMDHHEDYRKTGYPAVDRKEEKAIYSRRFPPDIPPPVVEESYRPSNIRLTQSSEIIKKSSGDYTQVRNDSRPDSFRSPVKDDFRGDRREYYNQQKGFDGPEKYIDKTGGNYNQLENYELPENFGKFPSRNDRYEVKELMESGRDERGDFYDRQRNSRDCNNYRSTGKDGYGRILNYEESGITSGSPTVNVRPESGYTGREEFGQSKIYGDPIKSGQSLNLPTSNYVRPKAGYSGKDDLEQIQDYENPVKSGQPLGFSIANYNKPPADSRPIKERGFNRDDSEQRNTNERFGYDRLKNYSSFDNQINIGRDDYDIQKQFRDPYRSYDKPCNRTLTTEDSSRETYFSRGNFHGRPAPEAVRDAYLHRNYSLAADGHKPGNSSFAQPSNSKYTWSKNQQQRDSVPHRPFTDNKIIKNAPTQSYVRPSNNDSRDTINPITVGKDPPKSGEIKNKDDAKDKPTPKVQDSTSSLGLFDKQKQNLPILPVFPDSNPPDKKTKVSVGDESLSNDDDDDDDDDNDSNPHYEDDLVDNLYSGPIMTYKEALTEFKVDTVSARDTGPLTFEKVRNIVGPCGRNLVVLWLQNEYPILTLDRIKAKLGKRYTYQNNFDATTNKWEAKILFSCCELACDRNTDKSFARKAAATLAVQRLREHYYTVLIKNDRNCGGKVVNSNGDIVPRISRKTVYQRFRHVEAPDLPKAMRVIDQYKASDNISDLEFSFEFAREDRKKLEKYAKELNLKIRRFGPRKWRFLVLSKKINFWTIVKGLIDKDRRFMDNYQLLPPTFKK